MKTANIYAGIVKMDENADGTLTVYGKATDDSLDIDQQICDAVWLDKAMPEWFMTGGNIREQHSNIAAGVAEEYEKKSDGHYITALVVDPVSIKKVKARVLKGFSIGIKSPRVVRDQKAANGRIVDGQIVEVSLVDRPANPNAKLILAKSAIGQKTLVKTEEFIEKHGDHDQSDHNPHGGSGASEKPSGEGRTAKEDTEIALAAEDISDSVEDLLADMENEGFSEQELKDAQTASGFVERAETNLRNAEAAKTDLKHQDALQRAYDEYDKAVGALSDIESGVAEDISDSILSTMDRIDTYLANINPEHEPYLGRSATVSKHGDHDQSDHNPHGGGSSGSNSEDKPERSGVGTSHIRETRSELSNARNEVTRELQKPSLTRHSDDQKDWAMREINDIKVEIDGHLDDASNALDLAEREGSLAMHESHLEDAMEAMDRAINLADDSNELSSSFGKVRSTLEGVRDNLEQRYNEVGKSATGKEPSMRERKTRVRKSALKKEADGMPMNGEAKAVPSREEMLERYASARKALDDVTRMCKEYGYGDIDKQYGETAEQETAEGPAVTAETAEEEVSEARGEKPLDKELVVEPNAMADKTTKCLECGCNMVGNDHGGGSIKLPDGTTSNMTSAEMVFEKSITEIIPAPEIEVVGTQIEEDSDEVNSTDKSLLADVNLNDIIEKAVKSAMSVVEAQVAELKSAKEAVENKASTLESELATAKSLAIGGGPKRTTIVTGAKTNNELLAKAEMYRAKATATTDPILAKGYRDLAKDFASKATEAESK